MKKKGQNLWRAIRLAIYNRVKRWAVDVITEGRGEPNGAGVGAERAGDGGRRALRYALANSHLHEWRIKLSSVERWIHSQTWSEP